MKGITLDRLEVLRLLGEGGGVLSAAGGSRSRQGQFSRQLKSLEKACGFSLIDRAKQRLQLNQKGEAIVQKYELLLEELGFLAQPDAPNEGLRIGGGEVALVEGVINLLEGSFPEIQSTLHFKNLRSIDAIRMFRRGDLDLVLSSTPTVPLREDEVCRKLLSTGYIIVMSQSASQTQGLLLKTLVREKLALLEGRTDIRAFLEEESNKVGEKLRLGALCSTYGQILELVEKGGFVGVIPSVCAKVALRKGLCVKRLISESPPPFEYWLLYRTADIQEVEGMNRVLQALGVKTAD